MSDPLKRPGRTGLALRALVLLLPLVGALVQSSCWVYVDDCDDDDDYCYDDDDDDFDDDDDDFDLTADGGGGPGTHDGGAAPLPDADAGLRLVTYEMIPSDEPGAHPVRRLVAIEGVSMRVAPPATPDESALAAFTKLVLFENWDLIGLPAAAGLLEFDGATFPEGEMRVRYAQRPSPLGVVSGFDGSTGSGGAMTFVFDRLGNLVEIDNATRVGVD